MKKLLQSLFILVLCASSAFAQERTVSGTVTSQEDGLPVPGASVRVKEIPSLGAQTGANGKFSLNVPKNGKILIVNTYSLIFPRYYIIGLIVGNCFNFF